MQRTFAKPTNSSKMGGTFDVALERQVFAFADNAATNTNKAFAILRQKPKSQRNQGKLEFDALQHANTSKRHWLAVTWGSDVYDIPRPHIWPGHALRALVAVPGTPGGRVTRW